ncbi:TPA: hypothetical protein EYP44_04345 [Candidatus Bathyarchaeota archaeon]|nr:hypothetical protein [Candidatus Bathyarchaeota archaeon]
MYARSKIVGALTGKHFSELVRVTGLSARWLSLKLKELMGLGVVRLRDNVYEVDHDKLRAFLAPSLREIAWMAAYELVKGHEEVLPSCSMGRSQGMAGGESDVDLPIISEGPLELIDEEYDVSMKYGTAFEITSMTLRGFIAMLHLRSSLLFGLLEGYDVLFDRGHRGVAKGGGKGCAQGMALRGG